MLTTSLSPLPSACLERSCHSRRLLRATGQLNLEIPTQAWQVPGHFCAKSNWHLPGKPKDCCCCFQRGQRGGNARSCKEDKAHMGGKKSFPVTRLELLLPGNLTRRKGTKPKRQQGRSKGNAQMIADIKPASLFQVSCLQLVTPITVQHSGMTAHPSWCLTWIFYPWRWSPFLILNVNLDTGFIYCLDIRLMQEEKLLKTAGKGRWFRIQLAEHFSKPRAN